MPDQELGIAMRNKRPEYLAICGGKNGSFSNGRGSDSFYQGKRFDDFGTTRGSTGVSGTASRIINNNGKTSGKQMGQPIHTNRSNAGKREEPTRGLEKSGSVNDFLREFGLETISANLYQE